MYKVQIVLELDGRVSYLIPTPPAMKTTFFISWRSTPVGGQTKLPPTRILISLPSISFFGFQSHAAGGLAGDSWTASSTYGARLCEILLVDMPVSSLSVIDPAGGSGDGKSWASVGVEVIVNPPAWEIDGMWTSSHWPGRKENACWVSYTLID